MSQKEVSGVTLDQMRTSYATYQNNSTSSDVNATSYTYGTFTGYDSGFSTDSGLFTTADRDDRVTNLKTREIVYIYGGTSGASITRTFYYDAKGRVIQIKENNHLNGVSYYSYKYDFMGNVLVSHEKHTANGTTYTVVTENTYDHRNRLTETSTSLNGGTSATVTYAYNALGQLEEKGLGNVSTVQQTYNIQGWLTDQSSNKFTMKLEYFNTGKYAGNITKWSWGHGSTTNQRYDLTYDTFGRLTSGIHSGGNHETIGGYDLNGNIQRLTRTGSTAADFAYTYTGNQLQSLNYGSYYVYDKNGNMTTDPRKNLTFTYNSLNLVQQVKSGSTVKAKYTYTSMGRKLGVRGVNNEGFDYLGSLTFNWSVGGASNGVECYFAEGMIKGNEITYFEKDHLGSIRVAVNQQNTVTARNDYYPFGLRHGTGLLNDNIRMRYNSMELQVTGNLGLIDYGARLYDPEVPRWLGADLLQEAHSSLSPYHYANNNPISYIDLYGLDYWSTNDPEQIRKFMENTSGNFAAADLSGWSRTSDSDFLANLHYNDESNTYWYTSTYQTDEAIVVQSKSFKGLASSGFGPKNDWGSVRKVPGLMRREFWLGQPGEMLYNPGLNTTIDLLYGTFNDAFIAAQSLFMTNPIQLDGSLATPGEKRNAGINTAVGIVSRMKLPKYSTVNAVQFNVIHKGTGINSATNGGTFIRQYNETIKEMPYLYDTYKKAANASTVMDYVSKANE